MNHSLRASIARRVVAGVLAMLACFAGPALAQIGPNCTVSILNRTVTQSADGSWVLPNVPANFGPVRARVTCLTNGQTVSGESDPFTVPANGIVNLPPIQFGQTTPIPTSLVLTAPTTRLTTAGQTTQLTVTARYSDNSTRDVTAGSTFTKYTVSNPDLVTVNGDGLVQAVRSGTALIQATHEGASGMAAITVVFVGVDSDGDGIPDDWELAHGMDPNNPMDALEDFDHDGLSNLQEYLLGTDPRNPDTDGDGLSDGDEVRLGTNPLLRDTDGDGIPDGIEVATGSDPLDPRSFNLAGALSGIALTPPAFTVTFNTISGDVFQQLKVIGTLRDGSNIDLTARQRGTTYSSSDLNVCNFSVGDGQVFAGVAGSCTVTVSVGGFTASASGTVHTFSPTALSFIALGGGGNSVDVRGNFVYVAVAGNGLEVVDVTDRSAPQVVATLALPGSANDVKLAGTLAYFAAGAAGLHVIDISNPRVPRLLGSVATPGDAADVRVRGNLAFVAAGAAGLQIIDVSNPDTPRIVGAVATAAPANGVDINQGQAVVAVGAAGVQVVDISSPSQPRIVGSVDTPGDAQDVVVKGSYAYVADYTGSLRVVDIGNPAAPALGVATPGALGGFLHDVAIAGSFVFGADEYFVNGVAIVDVTDPANPIPRARLDFPGDSTGRGIAADGSYLYLVGDDGRLYIGQYLAREDLNGIPPTVSIASPANGTTFVEGETIAVLVEATDDVAVASVSLLVDAATVATGTTTPYRFNVTAPVGASSLTLGASAVDLGNNTSAAADVVVNVIRDPLTTATGRVLSQDGHPLAGATVVCGAKSGLTSDDGTFAVGEVSTVLPTVQCTARFVSPDATITIGRSGPTAAVRNGVTLLGDIVVGPTPIVASLSPKVIDAAMAPATLRVTGSNLDGATFAFLPDLGAVSVSSAATDPGGTSATLAIAVAGSARGRFTLVGTNSRGMGDTAPAAGNVLTIINASDDVDSDGDGFPDGLELLYGSDPYLASSKPDLSSLGSAQSEAFAVVNQRFPSTSATTQEAQSPSFSLVNQLFPSTFVTTQEAQSLTFSLVNRLFPSTFVTTQEAQSLSFSLVNQLFPSTFAAINELLGSTFSVANSQVLGTNVQSPTTALVNPSAGLPASATATGAATSSLAGPANAPGSGGAFSVVVPGDGKPLVEGQTLTIKATAPERIVRVEFGVNGQVVASRPTAPYAWSFTVPSGVSRVTFEAAGIDASGNRTEAIPIGLAVQPDPLLDITGRVLDAVGNPVEGALVDILSEGVDAEFFHLATPPSGLPELSGRSPDRVTRLTAINMRNPGGMFGNDPLGSKLLPDFVGRLSGWMAIAEPGIYSFVLGASEAARLTVAGVPLIELPSAGAPYREVSGSIRLSTGYVPIELTYLQSVGHGDLTLSYSPPGQDGAGIASAFVPSGQFLTATTDSAGRFKISRVPTALASIQLRAARNGGPASGTSNVYLPTPKSDLDVGDIVIPAW